VGIIKEAMTNYKAEMPNKKEGKEV